MTWWLQLHQSSEMLPALPSPALGNCLGCDIYHILCYLTHSTDEDTKTQREQMAHPRSFRDYVHTELELELGSPRLQNLPSKGRTLLPWRGERGAQLVLQARVLLWHNQNKPEATRNLLHSCLCLSAHFKCKRILWSALKTQKLLLYTNMKPEGSQRPITPTPPHHTFQTVWEGWSQHQSEE